MNPLIGIVSGGQTGADRAALDYAINHGVAHGGWCAQGRLAEDGSIPERYNLLELVGGSYVDRTRQNVLDSEGTLILNLGALEDGTLATRKYAEIDRKPILLVQLDRLKTSTQAKREANRVLKWLRSNEIAVLNVAGPRESKRPGIYHQAYHFLKCCFG